MTRQDKIEYIAKHYGWGNQCRQCIEELAELTQALCKFDRAKTGEESIDCLMNIGEEIADVEIMISQLKAFLSPSILGMIEAEIDQKLNRQLKRIEKEKKGTC